MKKLSEVVSAGKMVGTAGPVFRKTSTSKPDDWHDRSGHDVGAARNYAHEKNSISKADAARRDRERKIEDRTRKAEQRAKDILRMTKESVESLGTAARVKIKNVARPDDANPTSEKSLLSKNGEIKVKKVDEDIADSISRKYGLTDSLIAASRQIMEKKTQVDMDPETDDKVNDDDDDDDVKKESKHTTPKSDKEKKLAALAHPKDKITHKDVLVGRGVVNKEEMSSKEKMKRGLYRKEEVEQIDEDYSKYRMSYEKGAWDANHKVINTHLDLTKSPLHEPGEKITTPERARKLVISHPKHKEMKEMGFKIKKYGEHSDSSTGKTTNEEAEQIAELKHSGILTRYMKAVKPDVDGGVASPKRKAGYDLALKKKWGDKKYGMEEPRVRATAEEFSEAELARLEEIAAKFP